MVVSNKIINFGINTYGVDNTIQSSLNYNYILHWSGYMFRHSDKDIPCCNLLHTGLEGKL